MRPARVGLFFALLEQEDMHGALALVDAMAAEGVPNPAEQLWHRFLVGHAEMDLAEEPAPVHGVLSRHQAKRNMMLD